MAFLPTRKTIGQLWWCLLSATLVVLSFPYLIKEDTNIWPFAWIALIPLLHVLDGASTKRGFWLGWFTGFAINMGGFWWISHVLENFGQMPGYVAWPLAGLNAAYQGFFFALFGWCLTLLRPADGRPSGVFRVAMIFTVTEFLFPMLFPWYLGNSQYRFLLPIQIADVTGVMGISFTIVLFNASLYAIIAAKRDQRAIPWRQVAAGLTVVALVFVYGAIRLHQVRGDMDAAPTVKLGLVEANVGILAEERRAHPNVSPSVLSHAHLLRYHRMSAELEKQGVDLIVWPESAYLPVGYMPIKRQPDFAVAVSATGRVARWRDHQGSQFQWTLAQATPFQPLRAVSALREDAFVAVGDRGTVVQGVGAELRVVQTPTQAHLLAVSLSPVSGHSSNADGGRVAAWAAGESGTLLGPVWGDKGDVLSTADGTQRWDIVPIRDGSVSGALRAIRMVSARNGWAVGDGGALVWIQDGTARVVPSGTQVDLTGTWHNDDHAWVVGAQGKIWRLTDRRQLRPERSGVTSALRAISGSGKRVIAVGDRGVVLERKGEGRWQQVGARLPQDLHALTIDSLGTLWVVDITGVSWTYRSNRWERTASPGIGPITAVAPLPYVQAYPMPKDARYVKPSTRKIPDETSFLARPGSELSARYAADVGAAQRGIRTPILYGGLTWKWGPGDEDGERRRHIYNTAVMLDEMGRVIGTYDKNYLLMFGEYIPLGDIFPVMYSWFPSGRFEAGRDVRVFPWRGFKIGVMICYEDIIPAFTRRLADKDPNIIINVTNDAWFGRTSEPYLHLALAVFRAVENRVVLVRSTNTGVSAFTLPTGALTQQSDIYEPETLVQNVPMMKGGSIYGQIGDGFTYGLMVWFFVLVMIRMRRRRRSPEKGEGSA